MLLHKVEGLGDTKCLRFSTDSGSIAAAGEKIVVFDARTGELKERLQRNESKTLDCFAVNADLSLFAGQNFDDIEIVDLIGRTKRELSWCSGIWVGMAFSPDSKELAIARPSDILLFDVHTGTRRTFAGKDRGLSCLTWSPDGSVIAAAGRDDRVSFWDVKEGKQSMEVRMSSKTWITCIAFNSDASCLAGGSAQKMIKIWGLDGAFPVKQTLKGHTGMVTTVAFSPGNKYIASGSCDKSVRVWDVETGEQVRVFQEHTFWVSCIAWAPNGRLIASAGRDEKACVWKILGEVYFLCNF
jgi:tricorn protease-like protein